MDKKERHLLMIVGMHRSGTSAVGHLLENIGFEFGNNLLEGIRAINDEGFWEDREIVALNEHIFDLFGCHWFDFERLPGKWWEDIRIKDLVGVAETWYYESFSGEKPIAVKDPRFCRLLPFWKRVFQGLGMNIHILFVFRHPAEVAASLKKRDGFPMQLGYLLWLSYTIDGLYYSRSLNLSLLHYDRLMKEPGSVIDHLCKKDIVHIPLSADIDFRAVIERTLDAKRYHQRSDQILSIQDEAGDIQTLAIELFEELVSADSESAKSLADKYRKRLYRLLDHHREVLIALREGILNQVNNNQKLFSLGDEHSHALAVIREKDAQLEENKDFIDRCLMEIENKDLLLQSSQTPSPSADSQSIAQSYAQKFDGWMADLNKLVDDYRSRIAEQKQYIAECEEKLLFQEKGLANNQEYIAKCHARIAEQDAGIAENRGYITACEERIRAQDEGLVIRDHQLQEKTEQIVMLEKSLVQSQEQLTILNTDLAEKVEQLRHFDEKQHTQSAALEESTAYIAKCHARIAEQDAGIAENRGYITACEERIRAQDEGLVIRDRYLEDKLQQILILEKSKLQLQDQLVEKQAQLTQHEKSFAEQQEQLKNWLTKIEDQQQEICRLGAEIVRLEGLDRLNHQRLALQKQQLDKLKAHAAALESELVALRAADSEKHRQLSRYRSYRVVQMLDKLFPEN